MDKQVRDPARERLADEAAEWLLRLEDASPREKREFVRWLKRSKDAPDEVLLAKSTDIMLRQLLRERPIQLNDVSTSAENVISLDAAENDTHVIKPAFRRTIWLTAAAASAAAVVIGAVLTIGPSWMDRWIAREGYTTSVGEQRAVELRDGSVISINARSHLRIAYSDSMRDVYLDSGQALFSVAKDVHRPFRVHAAGTVVQAVGTKFDVNLRAERVNVAVVEGVVEVADTQRAKTALASLADATRVAAGHAVTVDTGHVSLPRPINIADVRAWQQRRLVFRDTTLAEIAEEFARFNRTPHLRVEGDDLRARKFSGVFDADAPEALLASLATDESIMFERDGDDIVIRSRALTEPTL